MEQDDHSPVLALIREDRLPGQPVADTHLLTGRAREGLAEVTTLVVSDAGDQIAGVVQCAVRTSDEAA
ncbi:hypothetical protein [Streptomyces djakartensis]|uniref:hypothetical protein n=1 Tax=Streptomyces djakartensis TaxID=68193 RepID=UPI0034DE74B9